MEHINSAYNGYMITTDKHLMNVHEVHQWLSERSYWNKNISFETVKTAFDNSFCIGALIDGRQIAYARLTTDYAIFGYLADVYVEEAHRGKGISKRMMHLLLDLDWVKKLRGIKLSTTDAHGLYKQFGFTGCRHPERLMELSHTDQ